MCGSMGDIQSATTEIRRGKKERQKQDKNILSACATQGGHNNYNKTTTSGQRIWHKAALPSHMDSSVIFTSWCQHLPWAHPSPHTKRHLNRFSHFCRAHSWGSLCFTMSWPLSHSKLPYCTGDQDRHLIYGSLGPFEYKTQTTSRLVQPFLQGSRLWQKDQPSTNHASLVCNNRQHLQRTVMQPNNNNNNNKWSIKVIWHKAASLQQMDGSITFTRLCQCAFPPMSENAHQVSSIRILGIDSSMALDDCNGWKGTAAWIRLLRYGRAEDESTLNVSDAIL